MGPSRVDCGKAAWRIPVAESRADCEKAAWGISGEDPQREAAPTSIELKSLCIMYLRESTT